MDYITEFYPKFFKFAYTNERKIFKGEKYKITIGEELNFNTSNASNPKIKLHGFRVKVKLKNIPEQDLVIAHTEKDPRRNLAVCDYSLRNSGQVLWYLTKNYFDEAEQTFLHNGVIGGKVKIKKEVLINEILKEDFLPVEKGKIILTRIGRTENDY